MTNSDTQPPPIQPEDECPSGETRNAELTSIFTHDFRNQLMLAEGKVALAQTEGDPSHLASLEVILDRLHTLLEDFEFLTQDGSVIKQLRTVDIDTIASESWVAVEPADAVISTDQALRIRADPSRFQQLLENLFWNAIEHGPADVRIRIGSLHNEQGFFVADNGPGIPTSERDRVLQPGYTTTRTGTGYGLAIVSEIADAHGWTLTLTDSRQNGTRFEFSDVTLVET